MTNTFKIIALITFSFLIACSDNQNSNKQINAELEVTEPVRPKTNSKLPDVEREIQANNELVLGVPELEILDSSIYKILTNVGFEKKYEIAYSHDPYKITGMFNNDDFLDTAFIVKDIDNNKEGLIIRYGLSNPYDLTILGAGKKVLGQRFDEFNWVGDFKTIPKGSKKASNVDDDGEIITEEIPNSLKIELPNDGIYIHASESCGGGIIYFDDESYQWIQQE